MWHLGHEKDLTTFWSATNLSKRGTTTKRIPNVSRVYVEVNKERGPEYYNYHDFALQWGSGLADYEVGRKLGRGKYSDVFELYNTVKKEKCVVKFLKPVKDEVIKREIKILMNLQGGPNIVKLYDIVQHPETKTPALIFEHVDPLNFRGNFQAFSEADIQFYMFELLKALDYAHSNGIMHRDVKPGNILIDHINKQLRLIDWGLAEFYHVNKEYNVRVATRYYKGPELLVGQQDYDYSLDMWSMGCMFASMIFHRTPFFRGKDNDDQLVQIAKVLGSDGMDYYLYKYGIELDLALRTMVGYHVKKPWTYYVHAQNAHVATKLAIEFLDALLKYDPAERLTAKEAMAHPYFEKLLQNV